MSRRPAREEGTPGGERKKAEHPNGLAGREGELEEESLSQEGTAQSRGTERGAEAGGWEGKGTC